MTKNELIRIFLPLFKSSLTSYGYNIEILQAYQPTQTGIKDALYFFDITTERLGYPIRSSKWDAVQSKTISTDTQLLATTFQASALVQSRTAYTSLDVLTNLSMYIQSSEFIEELGKNDIGVFTIKEIRENWFKDDRDQYQSSPSFDFTLTYNRAMIRQDKTISTIEYKLNGV